jgi:hypothetical protein
MGWSRKVNATKKYNASGMFINIDKPSNSASMAILLKVGPSYNKNITYWQKKLPKTDLLPIVVPLLMLVLGAFK